MLNLKNCRDEFELFMLLMNFDNALDYNKEAVIASTGFQTEIAGLGNHLVGMNHELVTSFISGKIFSSFLENVCYNERSSVPYILRCLQLRIQATY
mgnify:CR=1 FL=1